MKQLRRFLYLFGAFSLAGTSVISARFVSGHIGTFTIAAISLFFAILGLLPVCINKVASELRLMNARSWVMIFLQAIFGIFLFRLFLLHGLMHTTSGEAGILTGITPAVTVLFARLFLKESINKQSATGILSTIAGMLLVQGVLSAGKSISSEHFYGNMLVAFAAVSESAFSILSRVSSLRAVSNHKQPMNAIVHTLFVSISAFLLCIIPSLFENPLPSLMALGPVQWLSLLWYGLFVTALAFIFWYAGIKRCPAYIAAAFSGMMPFTALLLSAVVLGESIGWEQWVGCTLIILGMLLIGGLQIHYPIKKWLADNIISE